MYLVYGIGKENSESSFPCLAYMHAPAVMTFGELSNDVDNAGTSSMCVVASRVAISYSCPASFLECNKDVNLLHGKAVDSGTTN
jgi:hypothetical protein